MRAIVVGATSWGCTLAIQLVRAGTETTVLCRTPEEAAQLSAHRENRRLLPGITLPEAITFRADLTAHPLADAVIFAPPAQRLRANATRVLAMLPDPLPPLVSASKGLEVGSTRRMSEVLAEEVAAAGRTAPIAVISGPNIAREIALEMPSTTVVAGDAEVTVRLRAMLMTPLFRVYTNPDLLGVELGGALKNVIAIGVGIGEALNAGANGRAAFLTRGLAEITRLGATLGASPLTFSGLTCLGDLIATTTSGHSRNLYVGEQLGHGRSLAQIIAGMVHVAEGVETTRAVCDLACQTDVEMPIAEVTSRILFEALPPPVAIRELMTRAAQDELAGLPEQFSEATGG